MSAPHYKPGDVVEVIQKYNDASHPTEARGLEIGDRINVYRMDTHKLFPDYILYKIAYFRYGWTYKDENGIEHLVNRIHINCVKPFGLIERSNKYVFVKNPDGCRATTEYRVARQGDTFTSCGENEDEVFYRDVDNIIQFVLKEYVKSADIDRETNINCQEMPF